MKLTTKWMLANYMPARAGIAHLVDARRTDLKEALFKEVVKHYPGFTVERNDSFNTLHMRNSETKVIMGLSGFSRHVDGKSRFSFVTCPGAGKYQDIWDPSNWSSHDVSLEVQALIEAADINNKLKVYHQELAAANETMQKVDKEQARLIKVYQRACDKVSKMERKTGQNAGAWFDVCRENCADGEEATFDLAYELLGSKGYEVLWDDLVSSVKYAADITADMLRDAAEFA